MRTNRLLAPAPWALVALALVACASGCTVRETTTPRTATEVLLLSTATERAVARYELGPLAGKRIAIDASRYEGVDRSFVLSALRTRVVRQGGRLVKDLRATKPEAPAPEAILEVRNATLGLWEGAFSLGIPEMQYGTKAGTTGTFPGFYLLKRGSRQAYCKLQLTAYSATDGATLQRARELWGHAYYNDWWVLGIGPILGNQDIYPEAVE